ncbi:hypothetical protein SAMN02982929_02103 [Saccharopolyspora kobensis]|uniref:Uncharacterized protein n=1 Tax=Saccharopolyspora kobensis TaxID=146035 RepID=A0A1H6A143_9PSEU|nr:hypothetical protein [Saccharopolyspora kobensis]SEG42483.1 hypothetical protein SAMN02982929_02103 [Saccharopolyspora kobensis]SFE17983.1 hypothetical protein SAMN05216506_109164 [Saccharopolyspora kobensis]
MGHPRLRPGCSVFTVEGRGTVLRDAAGQMFDIALPDDAVRSALTGAETEALAAFREAGHLGERATWPADRARVVVLADDGAPLREALRRAGAEPVVAPANSTAAELLAHEPAAVCAWSDGPAPGRWRELDALVDHGVAWQRASREGRHVLIEPVAGDVRHRDVVARRLAAAGSGHRHLAEFWAQHGAGDALHGEEAADAADLALVVALLVADLRAWAVGPGAGGSAFQADPLPASRRLRVVGLDTGAISDHPVLPVPASAP